MTNEQIKVTSELIAKATRPEQVFGKLGMKPGVGWNPLFSELCANLVIRVADVQKELGVCEGAGRLWELLGVAIAKIRRGSYGGEEVSGDWRDNMKIGSGSFWAGEVAREQLAPLAPESVKPETTALDVADTAALWGRLAKVERILREQAEEIRDQRAENISALEIGTRQQLCVEELEADNTSLRSEVERLKVEVAQVQAARPPSEDPVS